MSIGVNLGPMATDGSPFVSPCMFPAGVYLQMFGSSDDGSVLFQASSDSLGDSVLEWSNRDWVLMAGGGLAVKGGEPGDWISLDVFCPATPTVHNPAHTGNCNVVNGVIVPANGDGLSDVDLALANPVLTPLRDGYWSWNFPNTGRGTVTVGEPGRSQAHLLTSSYPLAAFARKLPVIGSQHYDLTVPAVEPKIILPHWRTRVTLHNGGHAGLAAGWYLTVARVQTT